MINKLSISDLLSAILVVCALVITAMVVRQQLFSIPQKPELDIKKIKNWQKFDFKGPKSGAENAPIRIVEFYDYQCPYCKKVQPALQKLLEEYPKQISLTHHHLPLPIHKEAIPAAIAAECARNQGMFKPMHKLIFNHQKQLAQLSYDSLAKEAGIDDIETFKACLNKQQIKDRVIKSLEQSEELGIDATPSFLIDGQLVSGALPYDRLEELVKNTME